MALQVSLLTCVLVAALPAASEPSPAAAAERRALNSITAAQLKGDLSFLASDALEGRYTPSPGLEVAAEFIASQFREAGLKPGGDQDYFQTASMVDRHMPKTLSGMTVQHGDQAFQIPPESIVIFDTSGAAKIERAMVLAFPARDLDALKRMDISEKAVLVQQPDFEKLSQDQALAAYRAMRSIDRYIGHSSAAIEIVVTKRFSAPASRLLVADAAAITQVPVVQARSEELQRWIEHPNESKGAEVSLNVPAPDDRNVTVKNVIGILPGSDPKLSATAVLLTAHYDHIGTTETAGRMAMPAKHPAANDHIYNGANDDGSGTVSVIEIARALAKLRPAPKRSIVFMTFFGEERGELGSKYYGEHPVFPIAKTVADINLEQVGRTDEVENGKVIPRINSASLTGFDYSDVTGYLLNAGKEFGVKVYKDAEASDAYFTRSDNDALAERGIPAHSLSVAFDYPDYHALGDEWQKVDYDNMARVDRMVALGIINIANADKAPKWNSQNPRTKPFRDAQNK